MKHCKATDTENAFSAYYNIGICHRVMGDHSKAYWYFTKAIEWAKFKEVIFFQLFCQDKESECLCHGQLGISAFLGKG